MSDSAESDNEPSKYRAQVSDSPESDRLSTGHEKLDGMANTSRMTSYQRREQLIEIGRSLFASKGFEAVSVEEIAATAKRIVRIQDGRIVTDEPNVPSPLPINAE